MGEFILGCILAIMIGFGAGGVLYFFIQNRKDKSK